MSYILDALRKAEHGRQTTPAPTSPILSESVPAAPADTQRRVRLGLLLVGVGIAAIAALMGWQKLQDQQAAPAAVAPAAVPAARAPATRPLSNEIFDAAPVAAREPARALDREAQRGQASAPVPASRTPGSAPARQAPRRSRGTVTVMGETQSGESGSDAAAIALLANGGGADAGSDNLPKYTDLLLNGQLNLPNLRMDMHVYNADPAKRFVFINVRKYREGERVEDRATVDTITRDGAVLSHNGVRFVLLPD